MGNPQDLAAEPGYPTSLVEATQSSLYSGDVRGRSEFVGLTWSFAYGHPVRLRISAQQL